MSSSEGRECERCGKKFMTTYTLTKIRRYGNQTVEQLNIGHFCLHCLSIDIIEKEVEMEMEQEGDENE